MNHRHGARLDAADKSWHLTSPTPYDPPLTYGGWTQSKALGLRIAALLHTQARPKRRHKIVIHTSPYLRCIQTSTAIAAGIAQFHPGATATVEHIRPDKILLRIDAFLGEWLCPDYYEDITSPPNSTMMVAGAKADLLRTGEYHELKQSEGPNQGHFPGGWAKTGPSGHATRPVPFRDRSSSYGHLVHHGPQGASSVGIKLYDSLVPSHAVSPSDPIPRGFTAHARDACLNIDFQWDSSRTPQRWGDGGEYGDEWSTMHKRFRKGLAGMMTWYKEHGKTALKETRWLRLTTNSSSTANGKASDSNAAHEDEDLVVIMVTHGAGCNALLGAISNQPILMDVGMASLSMAVRRDEPRRPAPTPPSLIRRPSVIDVGMSHEYDLKIIASVDHLRPGVDPSKPPQPTKPVALPTNRTLEQRKRYTSASANSHIEGSGGKASVNSSLGSIRRSPSSAGSSLRGGGSNGSGATAPSTGLWGGMSAMKIKTSEGSEGEKSSGPETSTTTTNGDKPPTTENGALPSITTTTSTTNGAQTPRTDGNAHYFDIHHKEEHEDVISPLPPTKPGLKKMPSTIQAPSVQDSSAKGSQQPGLWGGNSKPKVVQGMWGPPRLDDLAERAVGLKRRWTVTEESGLERLAE